MNSINPFNNQLIQEYEPHSLAEADAIILKNEKAFQLWKSVSIFERSKKMQKAAQILRDKKEKFGKLISLEMGKPINEARAEVEKSAWVCDYYAENAKNFLKDETIKTDASKSFVAYQPLGTILAVMPWNFPFWQVFRFAAPTLMAGNSGLLKHASNVPACAIEIEKIFQEAGFPENLFRTLLIPGSQVNYLIENPIIKAITLTGSEAAGRSIAKHAGQNLKKVVLELGGSDPFVVLADADVQKSAETAIAARMLNAGQSCIAAKRFIVHEAVIEPFAKKVKELIRKLKVGDPLSEETQIGPLARPEFIDDLNVQVKASIKMGAKLELGGKKIDHAGNLFEPTLLTNVRPEMPVFKEETFGPVFPIIKVKSEEEAIRIANQSEFGLGGSIWTQNLEKGEALARQIESGAVFVNSMTKSDPRLPFGGIKNSGHGRELSYFGIHEFVNIKTIWLD
jgi:succinate-semialdehyde dehydrogenase / glutarate-semialdehyde dehydrogenase